MGETQLTTPRRDLVVHRPHTGPASPLRAWSAADQLLLDHLGEDDLGRVMIVNDEFGALTCGLADTAPTVWTDSALSRQAIDANLARNHLPPLTSDQHVPGDQLPEGHFDTIAVRVPKTLSLLEHQLRALANASSPSTRIIGTGMSRHIHTSTVEAFESSLGPTTTSRATRKARLIHTERDAAPRPEATLAFTEFLAGAVHVAQLPGTFSADHLDSGSALLLDVLAGEPAPTAGQTVVDLGCGNGVLAASLAGEWSQADFLLIDVSDLAVAAAMRTWELNHLDPARLTATACDSFGGAADASVDIVVTNPPFHQGHALDADMTDRLLADAARVLRARGVAYVVAQRHLNLHTRLLQWFATVDVISKHPKFVVLKAESLGN